MMSKIKRNIPNAITTVRLIIAIIFPFLYLSGDILTAIIVFVVAASSDLVDGYLARRWEVESQYGRIVDPVADKMLIGFALLLMAFSNKVIIIPLLGEIVIVLISVFNYLKNKKILKVALIGKVKTIPLAITVGFGLLTMINSVFFYCLVVFACITFFFQVFAALSYSKKLRTMYNEFKNKYFKNVKGKNGLVAKVKQLRRNLEKIVRDKEKKERAIDITTKKVVKQ